MTDHTQVCAKELNEWLAKSKDLNLLDLAALLAKAPLKNQPKIVIDKED